MFVSKSSRDLAGGSLSWGHSKSSRDVANAMNSNNGVHSLDRATPHKPKARPTFLDATPVRKKAGITFADLDYDDKFKTISRRKQGKTITVLGQYVSGPISIISFLSFFLSFFLCPSQQFPSRFLLFCLFCKRSFEHSPHTGTVFFLIQLLASPHFNFGCSQQLLEKVGKGAFGIVYKALQLETNTFVAIKRMKKEGINEKTLLNLKVLCILHPAFPTSLSPFSNNIDITYRPK